MRILLCCLAFAGAVVCAQEPPDARWIPGEPLGLDAVGAGELLWKGERGWIPLPVVGIDVELTVTGILLHGTVRQRFHNPTAETIEVLYAFPLPERAAVHGMEMVIGDRRIRSISRERVAARQIYEQAKQSGRKAALLDQHRPNLFTTAAANINPGETIAVVLEYLEEVPVEDGTFRLRFPLSYTPRHGASGSRSVLPRARVRATLRPGTPLADVTSISHAILHEVGDDGHHVRTEDAEVISNRDFRLSWKPRLTAAPQAAVFVEEREDATYALAMLLPPVPGSAAGLGLATETLFVVDVSGSMAGPSIRQARQALLAALGRLRPDDSFNILSFNQGNDAFGETFQFADEATLETARRWVGSLEADGGTMIYPALMRGVRMLATSRSSRAQRMIFLTDGAVANEAEVLRGVAEHLGEARLHTIGIGNAPNAYLMRKMAWLGHGLCEFVSSDRETVNRIDAFFSRLDRPVMTDLDLRWVGATVDQVYPSRLGDLHAGQPLVVYGRFNEPRQGATLELGGFTRTGWIETGVALDDAPPGAGVATRWARARVEALMDSLHEGADDDAVRADVVEVGLDFNLVTAYTSLIAVEEVPTALGSAVSVRRAAALPLGGTGGPLRLRLGAALCGIGLLGLLGWRLSGRG